MYLSQFDARPNAQVLASLVGPCCNRSRAPLLTQTLLYRCAPAEAVILDGKADKALQLVTAIVWRIVLNRAHGPRGAMGNNYTHAYANFHIHSRGTWKFPENLMTGP